MSVTAIISKRIKRMKKGQPFTGAVFLNAGPRGAVDKALSRLVRDGTLERVIRGVYMRPKVSKILGRLAPSPIQVVEAIARARREKLNIHGAEAVRRLGLSTQMQIQPVYYTSGPTRAIRVGEAVVHLQHAPHEYLQHAGTKVGIVLTALLYLGQEEATVVVIARILRALSLEEVKKLQASRKPQWMELALERAGKDIEVAASEIVMG
ncbi:DUF6088 family protein [Pseudomonas japonica]|uniref:Transcriptional regulator, AbiEi antitoxin, Type IV TA system n=1 Tax=Pseudomonas japonica TaxID=256466 RepID=A0A239I453_9PSED|nr:DUF6088 family protein [Pseudomonas japonica]SNS88261.1 Transcriptional regulator, AbiEi antitoxin, Type IV TA system [Pseudomonas japonica]